MISSSKKTFLCVFNAVVFFFIQLVELEVEV